MWISVKDQLPEKDRENELIVYCPTAKYEKVITKVYYVEVYNTGEYKFEEQTYIDSWYLDNVTHWMHLPEKPST